MSQAPHAADRRPQEMRNFVADVEVLAASVRDGQWPRLGHVEGVDATGSVYLAIDDGGAFAVVHLDPGWWRPGRRPRQPHQNDQKTDVWSGEPRPAP